jgi:hypothetical protein
VVGFFYWEEVVAVEEIDWELVYAVLEGYGAEIVVPGYFRIETFTEWIEFMRDPDGFYESNQ